MLLLAILFDDYRFFVFSEPEIGRGYADLCLIARPEFRSLAQFDLLFELKLVRKNALKKPAEALRKMTEAELKDLPLVKAAFDEARSQIARYRTALETRFGDLLNLRCFTVVTIDLERVLAESP